MAIPTDDDDVTDLSAFNVSIFAGGEQGLVIVTGTSANSNATLLVAEAVSTDVPSQFWGNSMSVLRLLDQSGWVCDLRTVYPLAGALSRIPRAYRPVVLNTPGKQDDIFIPIVNGQRVIHRNAVFYHDAPLGLESVCWGGVLLQGTNTTPPRWGTNAFQKPNATIQFILSKDLF
ncbi:hypothetical protein BD779DRAFT_1797757 [Infundibulicybe gibba]|nr:hypothetical protein BD779DRAFT_1797757 [Infundibulicybe gibba]